MSNQFVMYCMNCGNKITVAVSSANITHCPECMNTSFTSQITLGETG